MSQTGEANSERGTTLLELLIVVAIVALLGAIAASAYAPTNGRLALERLTRSVTHAMESARVQALRAGRTTRFSFDMKERVFRVDQMNHRLMLPRNISAELIAAKEVSGFSDRGEIHFFPDGSTTGGKLTLKSKEKTSVIEVDWLTGRIQHAH